MAGSCVASETTPNSLTLFGTRYGGMASPSFDRDAELMVRVREGDDASFSILLERYRGPVMRFLYRMIDNHAIAEELTQEVFFRIYRSRAAYEPKAKFNTWVFLIATRVGLNWIRDTQKEKSQARLDWNAPDGVQLQLADCQPTREQELLHEVTLRAVRRAIEALPARQRIAVLMHKYEELNHGQIAEALGCTESAVKSLICRAYEALRAHLANESMDHTFSPQQKH